MTPVAGKVVLDDGTPVNSGTVIFEQDVKEKPKASRGVIQSDGSFKLSTNKPGDGAYPGKYKVSVSGGTTSADDPTPVAIKFDSSYTSVETSNLNIEIKPGSNDLLITLNRAKNGSKR